MGQLQGDKRSEARMTEYLRTLLDDVLWIIFLAGLFLLVVWPRK
ncbi:hypothetical protein ES703_69317 [subsurface metagenome]